MKRTKALEDTLNKLTKKLLTSQCLSMFRTQRYLALLRNMTGFDIFQSNEDVLVYLYELASISHHWPGITSTSSSI